MTKAERTRQFIIERSSAIFNTRGYDSTSLSDIQNATKLTKGAIYGNFANKKELAIAAYEHNFSSLMEKISALMKHTHSAKSALMAYANFYVQNWETVFKVGGCPMLNAAVEADDHLHYLRDAVRKSMQRFMKILQKTIEEGQARNEFKADVNSEEYAATIFTIMEGNILLAKTMNDPKYFQLSANRIKYIVEQELVV